VLSSNSLEKRKRKKKKMKMKSEKKKKKKKKEKKKEKEKEKKKNDAFVEQIVANKQLQMQIFVFVKKTFLRSVAKK
jgi:flagellar biosynthesis component FlhA